MASAHLLGRALGTLLRHSHKERTAAAEWLPPPAELLRIADDEKVWDVYVSGAHTILAHPDDCGGLFPMQFIKVATTTPWKPLLPATDRPFFVPRVEGCGVEDPEAFAMVLQVGKAELRILLLQRRFP